MYLCEMTGAKSHIYKYMVLQCSKLFYYKVSREFLRQNLQSSYSLGKIQNVGDFSVEKFSVSYFVFTHTHTHTQTHTQTHTHTHTHTHILYIYVYICIYIQIVLEKIYTTYVENSFDYMETLSRNI